MTSNGKSGWEAAEETANQDTGLFIRMKESGDSVVVAIMGEPWIREVCWVDGRTEPYDGNDPAHVKAGKQLKFQINAYVFGENGGMKIWETNRNAFRNLVAVKRKFGLSDWLVEIKRDGSGKQTKYSVLPERKLDDGEKAMLEAAELHDLERLASGKQDDEPAKPGPSGAQAYSADGTPF